MSASCLRRSRPGSGRSGSPIPPSPRGPPPLPEVSLSNSSAYLSLGMIHQARPMLFCLFTPLRARSLARSLAHSLTHSWLDVSVFGCFPELHDTVPLLLCAQANAVVIRRQSNMSSSIYLCMAATSAGRRQYCGRWLTPRCRISGDNFLLRWTLSGTPETFTKHSLRLIRYAACLLMLQSFMLCQPIPSVTSAVQIFSLEQTHGL